LTRPPSRNRPPRTEPRESCSSAGAHPRSRRQLSPGQVLSPNGTVR
jgi:hypothetical protein